MSTMTQSARRSHAAPWVIPGPSARRQETICMAIAGAALVTALQRRSVFWLAVTVGAAAMLVQRLDGRARSFRVDPERRPDPPAVDVVEEAGFQSFPASDPPAHY